ncbi:MAG: arsinothricin resistance N-acetyltransferase ArsN1 family B [Pseudomonadota bacterium]
MIRDVQLEDAGAICEIYNPYIEHTVISFEEETVSTEEMISRIQQVKSADLPWLVCVEDEKLMGYAYASRWKTREAYRFTAESTIYLADSAQGRGIGKKLYEALFDQLRMQGYHAVIGVIALPNDASVALHERMGFEKAAHFKEVGLKFGKWIDVGYWELLFDV